MLSCTGLEFSSSCRPLTQRSFLISALTDGVRMERPFSLFTLGVTTRSTGHGQLLHLVQDLRHGQLLRRVAAETP